MRYYSISLWFFCRNLKYAYRYSYFYRYRTYCIRWLAFAAVSHRYSFTTATQTWHRLKYWPLFSTAVSLSNVENHRGIRTKINSNIGVETNKQTKKDTVKESVRYWPFVSVVQKYLLGARKRKSLLASGKYNSTVHDVTCCEEQQEAIRAIVTCYCFLFDQD